MMIVRIMREEERLETSSFVQEVMRKQYSCEAYNLPPTVFIARRSKVLLGVMALSLSNGEPFHLEEIYQFEPASFPERFERKKVVELGRWAAIVPSASEILLYAAIHFAQTKDREWAIGEVKPSVSRRYKQLGLRLLALKGEIQWDHIPSDVLPFYLSPPKPALCALRLSDADLALAPRIKMLRAKEEFSVDLSSPE